MATGGTIGSSAPEGNGVEHFACPSCSAGMVYDPASGAMKCPYCGTTKKVETPVVTGGIPKHPLFSALASEHDGLVRPLTDKALEVHCDSCGSTVAFEPPEVAGLCPFCGLALVAQPTASEARLAPDAVLPAQISKEQSQAEVKEWLRTRWFAPNALKRLASQEAIQGVYLPFWSYDADTQSNYVGERGVHYYVTETYTETDSNGNTVQKTREVQHTRWSYASGQVSLSFSDLLVAASRSVQEKKLNALEPWALEKLSAYDPEYLAGFKAQRYQVELSDGFKEAQQVMAHSIDRAVRQDIGGDEQRVSSVDTNYLNAAFRQLLLPVWIGAYRFKGDTYQVVVNASTGEVQGERPYSFWKIASLILVILALISLLSFLYDRQSPTSSVPIEQPPAAVTAPVQAMPEPLPPAIPEQRRKHTARKHRAAQNHSSPSSSHERTQPMSEE